jgi:glycosyltransferase involved in cell wall biosynthesis
VHLNNSSCSSAVSHGLPLITTRGEILDSPFIDQENVFLCPPKNPEAMATAIETLIDNSELRQRLRLGALQLAQEWFSWERAIDRTMATFQ